MNTFVKSTLFASLFLALTLLCLPQASFAAQGMSKEAFQKQLEEILENNPELILNVLRKNSEAILDIAQQGANERRRNVLKSQWMLDIQTKKDVLLENRPILGDKEAPVTIVAFSDFTCPYCREAATTMKGLMMKHKGKIRYAFKHHPLNDTALLASKYFIAASMQDAEKTWKLYDILFARGGELEAKGETFLKEVTKELGFDMKKLAKDIKGRTVKAILEEDRLDAERVGVQGTPLFLVNDLVVRGALPPYLFDEAINIAFEEKQK